MQYTKVNWEKHFSRRRILLISGGFGLVLVLTVLYYSFLRQYIRYYPSLRLDPHRTFKNLPIGPPKDATREHEPGLGRVSYLHYLVPASNVKAPLCAGVTSALAHGYPIPRILGYKGKGKFDAHAAHIAKLRTIQRYLYNVNNVTHRHTADDDLVIIVDGFDVLPKLPASIMIERYFELVRAADDRLATRRGITVPVLHELGLQQTLLWGTDKGCFPPPATDARCWVVPYSDLPLYVWGPRSHRDEHGKEYRPYIDPRFLNSGTVMGPLGDLRKFIDATLQFIDKTFDPEHKYRNSDQYYMSTLYARQEFQRLVDLTEGDLHIDIKGELPEARSGPEDETEYHLFLDHESAFAQTRCDNEPFMQRLKYRPHDLRTTVTTDPFDDWTFQQYDVQMPLPVFEGLVRTYESLPENERPFSSAREWISSLELDTNVATHRIYPFFHQTCDKGGFVEQHQHSWYFPLIQPLMRASRAANDKFSPLHPRLVDGRLWMPAQQYPVEAESYDDLGGVFTDFEDEPFIGLRKFCKNDLVATIGDTSKPEDATKAT